MKNTKLLAASVLLGLSTSTLADINSIPDSQVQEKSKGFHGIVGIAAANLPEYVGSDETETIGLPLINVSYNDTYYFKFNRLGATWAVGDSGLKLGAELTMRKGIDDSDVLAATDGMYGLPGGKNIDDITLLGAVASYEKGNWSADLGIYGGSADENFADDEPGGEIVARFNYTFIKNNRFRLAAALKVEALSEDTVEYLYRGNDSATNLTGALIGSYRFSDRWVAMGAVAATSLGDEISDSPIVEEDTPVMGLIGIAYAF